MSGIRESGRQAKKPTLSSAIYGVAIRTFPAEFRDAHGREMVAAFRDSCSAARGRGRIHLWVHSVHAIGDLVAHGLLERSRQRFGKSRSESPSCSETAGGPSPNGRRFDRDPGRDVLHLGLFTDVLRDVRYAFRSLRRSRGFAFVAVVSLAVGIGVNAAVFTMIHAVWLAPVPGVTDQDRIVDMVPVINGHEYYRWAYPDFEDVRNADTPFEVLTAWAERDATFGAEDGGQRTRVAYVTSEYFAVLGAVPTHGRGFLDSEDGGVGQNPVAVVSFGFWQDKLGARDDILGHPVVLDGIPYTVVGVAPREFFGARVNRSSVDLWVPLFQHPEAAANEAVFSDRGRVSVQVLGRLQEEATLAEARAAVQTVFAGLARTYPETNRNRTVKAVRYGRFPAQNRVFDLIGVVAICGLFLVLLLIICGNLAGMALARSASREQEIGVRLALGSSRLRLIRFLMIEALILSVLGGGVGIVVAMFAMAHVSPVDLGIAAPGATFEPSGWTLVLSLVLSLVAAQAFGLLPAIRFSRPELVSSLKDETGAGGKKAGMLQRIAASSQVGTAFLLILMATLFVRSLDQIDESRIGFRMEGLTVTDFRTGGTFVGLLAPSEENHDLTGDAGVALIDRLVGSVESIPGVESAALASGFPLDRMRAGFSVRPMDASSTDSTGVHAEFTHVTEGFFSTVDAPVLQGRGILRTDDRTSPAVAVVTRSFANRLWPNEEPLGKKFSQAVGDQGQSTSWTVVGVVGDVAASVVTENPPQVFLPLRQSDRPRFVSLIRSHTESSVLFGMVRDAIYAVDNGLPAPRLVPAQS